MQSLQTLRPEQWAGVVLRPNPSVRLLESRYPTNRFLQAFYDDEKPAVPEAEDSFLAIYRKDGRVWRVRLPAPVHRMLAALMAGEDFAVALEACVEDHQVDVTHERSESRFSFPVQDVVVLPLSNTSTERLAEYLLARVLEALGNRFPLERFSEIEVRVAEASGQAGYCRHRLDAAE